MSTTLYLTVEEYGQMIERGAFEHLKRKIELIRGEIRQMNPAGPLHNDLIDYLNDWSVRATNRDVVHVRVQMGLDLSAMASQPEPDLLWLRADRYRQRHPTAADVKLAIEVSDGSLQSDLIDKAALYAEAGIHEYWFVDARGKSIHVFRAPINGEYNVRSVVKIGEHLSPLEPCSNPLDLTHLFE